MGALFGTDGIRGVANVYPMDVETAVAAGRAAAHYFRSEDQGRSSILIGQDTRLSGDMIAHSVSAGICSAGMDAIHLGVVPTPGVAHLARTEETVAAGIVVSASHNPYADNGIKIFNSSGYKLSDAQEKEIEDLMQSPSQNDKQAGIGPLQLGRTQVFRTALAAYIEFLKQSIPAMALNGVKIVLDCANGATFKAAPDLFQQLGADVTCLFCEPDGVNINAECGSQHPQVLAQTVRQCKADIGLAFDGDGDRLVATDESGCILTGDQIIAICANHLQQSGQLVNDRVVTTVMSNMGLHKALKDLGIELTTSQVGDRYVMQQMLQKGAILGGEDSGHIIFLDQHTTGDGLMAALRLIEALLAASTPLSKLARIMTVYPQELINVDVASKPDLDGVPQIVKAILMVENELGDEGRVLVRYSGTQAKCRVMVEGPTQERTQTHCRQIADVISKCLGR